MKPQTNQHCEICGKESYKIIIDSKLKESSSLGNRGRWLFMCPACHLVYGQGFREDRCTIYIRINGKYLEQKGIYSMTVEEIQETIDRFSSTVTKREQADVVLVGEIALQLAIWNRNMEENNSLLRRVLHPLMIVKGTEGESNVGSSNNKV